VQAGQLCREIFRPRPPGLVRESAAQRSAAELCATLFVICSDCGLLLSAGVFVLP
jgi:hypothetical protein